MTTQQLDQVRKFAAVIRDNQRAAAADLDRVMAVLSADDDDDHERALARYWCQPDPPPSCQQTASASLDSGFVAGDVVPLRVRLLVSADDFEFRGRRAVARLDVFAPDGSVASVMPFEFVGDDDAAAEQRELGRQLMPDGIELSDGQLGGAWRSRVCCGEVGEYVARWTVGHGLVAYQHEQPFKVSA